MRHIIILTIIFILNIPVNALSNEKRYGQCIIYLKQEKYEEALRCLKEIVKNEPKATKAYNDLGLVYAKLGRLDEAIRQWLKALSIDPTFLIARYNLVRAYLNKNDYNNAILQLKTIIEQSPKEEKAYNILGIIYWTLGQYKLAETAFKKALEIKSDYKMAQLNLAHLYVEEAIKQYKKLYLLNPQDEEIKEEYKCILKVNKRDANAHFLLGRLYQREGNLNKAIYEYRMASKLSEKYNALFFLKEGNKLRKKGNLQGAAQNYKIALALDPNLSYAYYYLGLIYQKLGKYKEAIISFKKALSLKNEPKFQQSLLSAKQDLEVDIKKFINKWLEAWQKKDLKKYATYYSPRFYSNGMDLEKWLSRKDTIFSSRGDIKIKIDNLEVNYSDSNVVVCFHQHYQDNQRKDEGKKCLYLEDRGNWRIIREEWYPL